MSGSDPVVVTPAVLRDWALPAPGGGKGARGTLLVVGGCAEVPGAVRLSGEAGLRAGAGRLALATLEAACWPLAVAVPEARVVALPASDSGSVAVEAAAQVAEECCAADVALIGPGFSDPEESSTLLAAALPDVTGAAVVLDALASAFLTDHPDGLHHLEGRAVLTVNPTELAHTAGRDKDDVARDPVGCAAVVARRSRVVVVCGGTQKHVVAPDGRSWVIQGGGPGLGVSGSGDVQSGIVAGLLARGADPVQAAVWGGYLHARAGERLAAAVGSVGYLSRELPGQVPAVLSELA
ncbi:ADP-dependent NAD(P)H-hydrate dehydratase [Nocardioides pacificus]